MLPHDLRCPTNPFKPEYVGFCERCSKKIYFKELRFQYDWRGNALANLNVLVCRECEDFPNEQFRPVIIGPDALPPLPRPTPWFYEQQSAGIGLTAPPTPQTHLQVVREPTRPGPQPQAGTPPRPDLAVPSRLAVHRDEEFM